MNVFFKILSPLLFGSHWLLVTTQHLFFILTPFENSYCAERCSPEFLWVLKPKQQITSTWYQSTAVHMRNCFKQTQKGSAKKSHKYFILKFFFIIYLERWKKLKKRNKENNPNKHSMRNYSILIFLRVVFHREKHFIYKHLLWCGSEKNCSLDSSLQIPVLFPETAMVYIWLFVWESFKLSRDWERVSTDPVLEVAGIVFWGSVSCSLPSQAQYLKCIWPWPTYSTSQWLIDLGGTN